MENTTTAVAAETKDSKYWLRFGLAWMVSLFVLFLFFYIISKAWKAGQTSSPTA